MQGDTKFSARIKLHVHNENNSFRLFCQKDKVDSS